MFPIDAVRAEFPALQRRDDGVPRVYLDNPAGTQVPLAVAQAASAAFLESNANLGGSFRTSRSAQRIVDDAHAAMAVFLGAGSIREIAIGPSTTALTFEFSRALAREWKAGDEIVVTQSDHDANIAPWLAVAEDRGLRVRFVPLNLQTWRIEEEAFDQALSSRTRLTAVAYAGNVTGSINDVARLCALAKARGALVYVDAVQFAPHGCIDVRTIGADFLACSSYKFFGPHLGIVWGREDVLRELRAYKVRPQTEELPWKFELGTPQMELQAALTATVAYFERLGPVSVERREKIREAFRAITAWERTLAQRLIEGLERISGVRVRGIRDAAQLHRRVPTVSFTHEGRSSASIAAALAERNVFVWSGNNFGLETVRAMGVDEDDGVVRVGIVHYNTPGEIDRALDAIASAVR
jgi:cysteine desulfurase family protein (TIGR01976 family)